MRQPATMEDFTLADLPDLSDWGLVPILSLEQAALLWGGIDPAFIPTFAIAKQRAHPLQYRRANIALKELEDAEFLIVSRQGGKNQCSLYALTCFRIDDCGHDLPSTSRAPDDWKRRHYELSPAPQLKQH